MEKMCRRIAIAAALLAWSCATPSPPAPPPPPAPPVVQPAPRAPQEELSIQGRSQPAGPGKQSVVITVNGELVINGALTTKSPHATFHGKYHDHDIQADCTLRAK